MADKNRNAEEIVNGFNTLRNEQRRLAYKISEMEVDLNEHKYDSRPFKPDDFLVQNMRDAGIS
jgi:hypothetical protein